MINLSNSSFSHLFYLFLYCVFTKVDIDYYVKTTTSTIIAYSYANKNW